MEILRFDPATEADLVEISKLYADVFAGPPWNENTKCPVTENYFGLETKPGIKCPEANCSGILQEAYLLSDTIKCIAKEIRMPKAITVGLKKNSRLVGFSWGFAYGIPELLAGEKYRTQNMRNIIKAVLNSNGILDEFFYISECGIGQNFRGIGLSNELFSLLSNEAAKLNLPVVMRTNCKSPMVAVAERFGMRQVFGPKVCVDRDKKQFIVYKTGNKETDQENKNRVLFVRG